MKEPFELEWLGGPTEHHFRRARPGTDDLPWGTIPVGEYPPGLVAAARRSWTEVAINEYHAVVSFSEMLRALALSKAPLDLLGMTSDFLADECSHVELASRVAMELGGGAPLEVDMETFGRPPPKRELSLFQRANEIVLAVSCVTEAFSGGAGLANRNVTSHPLTRAVYDTVLADEARHRRLGALYFEWAAERLDDAERARLATVAVRALDGISRFWKVKAPKVVDGKTRDGWKIEDLHALGWLEAEQFVSSARDVVRTDILAPLDAMGIVVPAEDRARILA